MFPVRKLACNMQNRLRLHQAACRVEGKNAVAPSRITRGSSWSATKFQRFLRESLGADMIVIQCGNFAYSLGPSMTGEVKELYDQALPLACSFASPAQNAGSLSFI